MYPITSAIKYHLAHLDWHSCFCSVSHLFRPELGFNATAVPSARKKLKIRPAKPVRCGAQSGLTAWKLSSTFTPYFYCASASLHLCHAALCNTPTGVLRHIETLTNATPTANQSLTLCSFLRWVWVYPGIKLQPGRRWGYAQTPLTHFYTRWCLNGSNYKDIEIAAHLNKTPPRWKRNELRIIPRKGRLR
jgi:hypothetical protein